MTYIFKTAPMMANLSDDVLIVSALNGVVYIENGRLHINGNNMHFVYKPDGSPVGWYARNKKSLDDICLGTRACPTIDLEDVQVKNDDLWKAIQYSDGHSTDTEINNYILNQKFIPSQEQSMVYFAKAMLKAEAPQTDIQKLELSGLYDIWQLGNYSVGDIRNYAGQTWECWTAHDNSIYPDITPDNPQTWANFWRPLHGTSIETARPWTKPVAGTTDMYHIGEYMVYTDGKIYKCLADTVYSPEEYAVAWEIVDVT